MRSEFLDVAQNISRRIFSLAHDLVVEFQKFVVIAHEYEYKNVKQKIYQLHGGF